MEMSVIGGLTIRDAFLSFLGGTTGILMTKDLPPFLIDTPGTSNTDLIDL